ncbi:hypothetical protein BD408DRAFT_416215 [Parasitella parasitica]|nr:hypothetical protein BD408DRAFT_416215 [Parasitella parasitica]
MNSMGLGLELLPASCNRHRKEKCHCLYLIHIFLCKMMFLVSLVFNRSVVDSLFPILSLHIIHA